MLLVSLQSVIVAIPCHNHLLLLSEPLLLAYGDMYQNIVCGLICFGYCVLSSMHPNNMFICNEIPHVKPLTVQHVHRWV